MFSWLPWLIFAHTWFTVGPASSFAFFRVPDKLSLTVSSPRAWRVVWTVGLRLGTVGGTWTGRRRAPPPGSARAPSPSWAGTC